jgi:hypothetical protein
VRHRRGPFGLARRQVLADVQQGRAALDRLGDQGRHGVGLGVVAAAREHDQGQRSPFHSAPTIGPSGSTEAVIRRQSSALTKAPASVRIHTV